MRKALARRFFPQTFEPAAWIIAAKDRSKHKTNFSQFSLHPRNRNSTGGKHRL